MTFLEKPKSFPIDQKGISMICNNTIGEIENIIAELYQLNKDITDKLSACKDLIHQLKTSCENASKEFDFCDKNMKDYFDFRSAVIRHQADYLSAFLNDTAHLRPDMEAIADNLENVRQFHPVSPDIRTLLY